MAQAQLLLTGLALTFADADGSRLNLIATLNRPAPVTLQWGTLTRTSSAGSQHVFAALPAEVDGFMLSGGSLRVRRRVRRPVGRAIDLGVIGDGGRGQGPRALLLEQIRASDVDAMIAFGSPLKWPLVAVRSPQQPAIVVRPAILGAGLPTNALRVVDGLRDRFALPAHVHHLRLGATLVWVLDASLGFADGDAQARFARAVGDEQADARWRVMVVADGPVSSGPRGGYAKLERFWRFAARLNVDLIVSGQDRIYERAVRGDTTVVVSGASGAVVDPRVRVPDESVAMIGAAHWVWLRFGAQQARLRAYGVEGSLLDDAPIPPGPGDRPRPVPWGPLGGALILLIVGLFLVSVRLLRPGHGPS